MAHHYPFLSPPIPEATMRSMFAARKAVFVDLLKWNLPVLAGHYEIDQFDTHHADYIVLTKSDGEHLGSARLLPTSRPHILGSFYAHLCEEMPPNGPQVAEITRFCLDRRLNATKRRQVRDNLVMALADHAIVHGITTYVAIAGQAWFAQIERFGWQCRALGAPGFAEGSPIIALRIDITPETPQRLRQGGIGSTPGMNVHRTARHPSSRHRAAA
ncbi:MULTISPECIES: acyl-homoserine-lactone synthase [unclassified Novosphingobium]|uniref:acyl-homoserine-lactone synthase n=1 Tax=unclassified Novosphingobium TaxID=2644732 RepID=UPI0008692DDD|nr:MULTISPECIES: acyl-homoserine-lactone synthase [unclassified Novosphingobium]MBN9145679.1 GNAT family N-acetyltransferase [Novosphingobium sp.]ODU80837.1 MAG: autoinducer synthase [Novosphingobium sp. SCN 63-17]OJX87997.1 MAG: autoinducer synthase [Novosphingobium sp. 63-713]